MAATLADGMKIAVVGTRGMPGLQGGVERHCESLYPLIASEKMRVRVYRRIPYIKDAGTTDYGHIGYVDLPSTRIKGVEALLHTLLCCCHVVVSRPDVVHVHNMGPGVFIPFLRLAGLPVVMTYHSVNYEHKKWGTMARRLLKLCEKISLGTANRVIFVNSFQMAKYSGKIQRKSCYIPNGVDFHSRSNDCSFLQRYGIKAGRYVLAVGRITPEKGFEYLVEAANRCDLVGQVVIAGASDHDTAYLERLKSLDVGGKVVFTGFTAGDDLRQLYSHAGVYVLSSVNEGFPLVLLESMSYGLPILASDIAASHLVDLPADRYFKAGDVNALSAALAGVYEKAGGLNAFVDYDLSQYNWRQVAERTAEVLSKAARKE